MFANYRSLRLATGFILVILTVAGLCPQLFAEEAASASASTYKAPAYQVLRQNENWSGLAAQGNNSGGDPFDSIKFIPLVYSFRMIRDTQDGLRCNPEPFWSDSFASAGGFFLLA